MEKNYYTKQFKNASFKKTIDGNVITLDVSGLGQNLDKAQDALDSQVWSDMQMYIPMDTGNLVQLIDIQNMSARGEVYFLPPESDYGHYMYEGELYVDPVYGKGAFYSEEYGFWSRPGVDKIPSGKPLNYAKDKHPLATSHWDEVAFENHYQQWVALVKSYV